MPGAGTRTAITNARRSARCLDLTRLISRLGRGPLTGVDRVELAYLRHLLTDEVPLYLLVRTVLGHVLLDQTGAEQILARLTGAAPWGKADVIGALSRRMTPEKRTAEADLRRMAIARCRSGGLADMLARHLPTGTTYFNVGHSNLTDEVFDAWFRVPGARVTVLVHDMIPLDFPQYQRPGMPDQFRTRMRRVSVHADLVIYNSQVTRDAAERWFGTWGRTPDGIVAHLGLDLTRVDRQALSEGLQPTSPYFVTLGTIEPRKNHALLLDTWDAFADEMPEQDIPHLVIAGSRGWANEDVFRRLDTSALMNRVVWEQSGLEDAAITGLLQSSAGLLFPSHAEGFGLPLIEATALNVPVICSDLPVYREFLGNIPVYLKPGDVYSWKQSITRLADRKRAGHRRDTGEFLHLDIPTWDDHFNFVLKVA